MPLCAIHARIMSLLSFQLERPHRSSTCAFGGLFTYVDGKCHVRGYANPAYATSSLAFQGSLPSCPPSSCKWACSRPSQSCQHLNGVTQAISKVRAPERLTIDTAGIAIIKGNGHQGPVPRCAGTGVTCTWISHQLCDLPRVWRLCCICPAEQWDVHLHGGICCVPGEGPHWLPRCRPGRWCGD